MHLFLISFYHFQAPSGSYRALTCLSFKPTRLLSWLFPKHPRRRASGKKASLEGMRGCGCGSLVFLLQVKMKMTVKVNKFHPCTELSFPPKDNWAQKVFYTVQIYLGIERSIAYLFSYFVLFYIALLSQILDASRTSERKYEVSGL